MKIISLGGNCCITYQLKKLNLKNETYPFDWSKININQLLTVLENNFENYSESLSSYKISLIHKTIDNTESLLVKNSYNITFAHEICDEDELEEFKKTIKRRINRFLELGEPIIFVRIELCPIKLSYKNKIIKLCNLLNKYSNNYILKIVINSNLILSDLPDNVKLYYYNEFDSEWEMNKINWSTILN